MKDINFDELDKAVNSVLQQSTKPDDPKEAEVAPEPEITKSAKKDEANPSVASAQVVTKRRGQFMDMVHPSSDMTTSNTSETKKTPMPSRQSATIKPLNPEVVETAVKTEKQEPEAKVSVDSDLTSKETKDETKAVEPERPDIKAESVRGDVVDEKIEEKNIDNNSLIDDEDGFDSNEDSDSLLADDSVDKKSVESTEAEEVDDRASVQETPFIQGQDVEKRPLGAFTGAKTQEDDPDDVVTEPEVAVPTQMPQELTPEIVSVESDDPTRMTGGLMDLDAEESGAGASMASSIPQQYSTMPDGDDQDGHPVFDTKEYHQPLTPPAKHSYVGLIVFLVILIAALGAGAWYAIAVLKLF